MSETGIGKAVRRREDIRFITGQGRYVDDINQPAQTWAVFLRSPLPRARIASIDTSAALAEHRGHTPTSCPEAARTAFTMLW